MPGLGVELGDVLDQTVGGAGTRALNTPLDAGTPITAETCAPTNRLQRWQLTRTGDTVTLTNAITRMIAVLTEVLVQQLPDSHTPTAFTLLR